MLGGRILLSAMVATLACCAPALAAPSGTAPGAPGANAVWTEADKDGYGTSTTRASKVWFTLDDGILTEVYYPDLSTPSVRDFQLVVSDGRTAWRERDSTRQQVELLDRHGLVYRQTNTARNGAWRITKTYVTDPRTNTLLVRVGFKSLSGKRYRVFALYDPGLGNGGNDDTGISGRRSLVATDCDRVERAAADRRLCPHLERLPRHQRRLGGPAPGRPHELAVPLRARRQRGADRAPAPGRHAAQEHHAGPRLRAEPGRGSRRGPRLAAPRLHARGQPATAPAGGTT